MQTQNRYYPWIVLGILFLNIMFSFIAMYCMPPLFSEIIKDIPLTKTQMGIVMGAATLSAIFCTPIAGGLSDKIGCRWVVGWGAITGAIAGGLRFFSHSVIGLTACMFFLGAGIAASIALMPKVLSTWFPKERLATVNGICFASVTVGTAIAMGTSAKIMSPAFNGWRGTMVVISSLLLIMGILWVVIYRDRQTEPGIQRSDVNIAENFKTVLKITDVRLFSVFYGLIMGSIMALMALLPITLQERGIERAGEMVSIFLVTSLVFKVIGGIVSDKLGKRKIFIIFGSIILGICIPGYISVTGFVLVLLLIVAGMAVGPVPPTMLTAVAEIEGVGNRLSGTALGIILMVGTIGGSVGPFVAGLLMDGCKAAWPGFVFMAVTGVLAGLIFIPTKTR